MQITSNSSSLTMIGAIKDIKSYLAQFPGNITLSDFLKMRMDSGNP
ncbi:MAG: hypothetical protein LBR98_00420 [Syntrophomonadaceae bacterium]|nr:hypothetical protein [Syntrophomonadaceae bacterium]